MNARCQTGTASRGATSTAHRHADQPQANRGASTRLHCALRTPPHSTLVCFGVWYVHTRQLLAAWWWICDDAAAIASNPPRSFFPARCRLQLPLPTVSEEVSDHCCRPLPAAAPGPLFAMLRDVPGDAGVALPDPVDCVAEDVLVRQVASMLLGEASPGACLQFQQDTQRFAAAPNLHVPSLSPTLLANVLQPLMGYGAVAVRLRRFLQLVEDGRNAVRVLLCVCD